MDMKFGSSAGARDLGDVHDKWRQLSNGFLLKGLKAPRVAVEIVIELCRRNIFEIFMFLVKCIRNH